MNTLRLLLFLFSFLILFIITTVAQPVRLLPRFTKGMKLNYQLCSEFRDSQVKEDERCEDFFDHFMNVIVEVDSVGTDGSALLTFTVSDEKFIPKSDQSSGWQDGAIRRPYTAPVFAVRIDSNNQIISGVILQDTKEAIESKERKKNNPGRSWRRPDSSIVRLVFEDFFNFNSFPRRDDLYIGKSWADSSEGPVVTSSRVWPKLWKTMYSIDTCIEAGTPCIRFNIREIRTPFWLNETPSKRQSLGVAEKTFFLRLSDGLLLKKEMRSDLIRIEIPEIKTADDISNEVHRQTVEEKKWTQRLRSAGLLILIGEEHK